MVSITLFIFHITNVAVNTIKLASREFVEKDYEVEKLQNNESHTVSWSKDKLSKYSMMIG